MSEDGSSHDVEKIQQIRDERGYSYKDEIEIARDTLPNYDEKVKYETKKLIGLWLLVKGRDQDCL